MKNKTKIKRHTGDIHGHGKVAKLYRLMQLGREYGGYELAQMLDRTICLSTWVSGLNKELRRINSGLQVDCQQRGKGFFYTLTTVNVR